MRTKSIGASLVVTAAAGALLSTSALASPQPVPSRSPASPQRASAPLPSASAETNSKRSASAAPITCPITRGNYTGRTFCFWQITELEKSNGIKELFIIGTDYAVWHIWQRFSGDGVWSDWHKLGGETKEGAENGVWARFIDSARRDARVVIWGTDSRRWCKDRYESTWYDWYTCQGFK